MSTWEIDAKSAAYRAAQWISPTAWRGLEARTQRTQRDLIEGAGSLRKRGREAEGGLGEGTSEQQMTRERHGRVIQKEWERYKIYATALPGEWMHYTTYEGVSTERRMASPRPTPQQ